jgi:hypothetical protein
MFNRIIEEIKEFFYDEPMAFFGTLLMLTGLLGAILMALYILLVSFGFMWTLAGLAVILIIVGGVIRESF